MVVCPMKSCDSSFLSPWKLLFFLGWVYSILIYIYIWMIYSYITIVANCCLYWSDYEDLPSTYLSPLTSHNFITYITFPFYRGW
jgi:hypothetical protein